MTGHADEVAANGHVACHLGRAIVDQREENVIDEESQKETGWPRLVEGLADTQEQRRADGASYRNELDLPVRQRAVESIGIARGDKDFVVVFQLLVGRCLEVAGLGLLFLGEAAGSIRGRIFVS